MQNRESLMALLWPKRPGDKANVTLRSTLSRLCKSLNPAGDFLISEGGKVGLDFAKPHNLELARLATAGRSEIGLDELTAIMVLVRGEFPAEFARHDAPVFDNWAAIQREVEAVFDTLSELQLASRDTAAAVETSTRWVARVPLSEAAYRSYMAAQALAGDRAAASGTFNQYLVIQQ